MCLPQEVDFCKPSIDIRLNSLKLSKLSMPVASGSLQLELSRITERNSCKNTRIRAAFELSWTALRKPPSHPSPPSPLRKARSLKLLARSRGSPKPAQTHREKVLGAMVLQTLRPWRRPWKPLLLTWFVCPSGPPDSKSMSPLPFWASTHRHAHSQAKRPSQTQPSFGLRSGLEPLGLGSCGGQALHGPPPPCYYYYCYYHHSHYYCCYYYNCYYYCDVFFLDPFKHLPRKYHHSCQATRAALEARVATLREDGRVDQAGSGSHISIGRQSANGPRGG